MKIEVGKEYKTRDGDKARIYATDGSGSYPVHGAVYAAGRWELATWTDDGEIMMRRVGIWDIVGEWREPMKVEGWVNVYPGGNTNGILRKTKEKADHAAEPSRIACIYMSGVEGVGPGDDK